MKVKKVLAAGGWLCVLNKERSHWWVSTMREFIMRDREMLLWMHKSVYRMQAKDAVYCYICNIHVHPRTQLKWENCTNSTRWSGSLPGFVQMNSLILVREAFSVLHVKNRSGIMTLRVCCFIQVNWTGGRHWGSASSSLHRPEFGGFNWNVQEGHCET